MSNKTLQKVLELEQVLIVIEICDEITSCIEAESQSELEGAAADLKCKLYHPFESEDNDFYYFDYVLPRHREKRIRVKSKERFRISSKLIEI